jgi:hypothetical protein
MPASSYEIRIKGRLGEALQAAFSDLTVTTRPAETVVYGPVADQAALHGLLDRIQGLGLEVVEVRLLPGDEPGAAPGGSRSAPRA